MVTEVFDKYKKSFSFSREPERWLMKVYNNIKILEKGEYLSNDDFDDLDHIKKSKGKVDRDEMDQDKDQILLIKFNDQEELLSHY